MKKINPHEKIKDRKKVPVAFSISLIVIVTMVLIFYFIRSLRYQTRFLPNTEVYNINISDKTLEESTKELHSKLDNVNYVISENNKKVYTINSKNIQLKKDYTPLLKDMLNKQNPAMWGVKVFAQSENYDTPKLNLTLNKESLKKNESELKTIISKDRVAPENAKIVQKDGKFQIVKEVDGNTIDFDKLKNKINKSIYDSNTSIKITDTDYEKPKIRENNQKLVDDFKQIQKIEGSNITYQVANAATIKVPEKDILSWISYNDNKVSLNNDLITTYLSSINDNYSTVGGTRNFKTSDGQNIQVKGGTYGRQISIKDDLVAFDNALKNGESKTIKATTIGQGQEEPDINKIGNTYVEVSLAKQHEWVYVNGNLFIDTDIVSGKPNEKNATPTGTFVVWSKQQNATLKGQNDNGSSYASPVAYWMPIDYTGVGLHDSPWQPKYGGEWYVQHGSHGCINNPPSVIAKFYPVIPIGTPVIIY